MSWLVLIHCCHIRQIDNKSRSLLVTDNPKELLCQILCVEFKLQVKFSILESICIDLTGHLKISKWTSRSKSQALIWEWWGMSCNNLYKKIKFLFPSFYPSVYLSLQLLQYGILCLFTVDMLGWWNYLYMRPQMQRSDLDFKI